MKTETNKPASADAQPDVTPKSIPSIRRERWYQRLKDRLWGYDFFISYQWASGGTYAVNLAARLREKGYEVFLDRAEYAMGDAWKRVGEVALRNTQRLVLIATREAVFESKPVEHEIVLFTNRGHHCIPIFFGDTFAAEQANTGKFPVLDRLPDDALYIEDTLENLPIGPASEVIEKLAAAHGVMRRRKLRQTITLVALSLLTTFAVFASISWVNAIVARNQALKANRKASLELGNASWQNAATARDRDGHTVKAAHSFLRASLAFTAANEKTRAASADWAAAANSLPVVRTFPHNEGVVNSAFSKDGRYLATCTGWDGAAWIWDLTMGSRVHRFAHRTRVDSATFGNLNDLVLFEGLDYMWINSIRQLKTVREFAFRGRGGFSPDDSKLVLWRDPVWSGPFHLMVWEVNALEGGDPLWEVEISHTVRGVQFSQDGKRILTWRNDVRLYDAVTGFSTSAGHAADGALFLPDGASAATWGRDGIVRIIATDPLAITNPLTITKEIPLSGAIARVAIGETSNELLALAENKVHNVDIIKGVTKVVFQQTGGKPWATQVSRNGRRVVTWSGSKAQLWETETGTLEQELCHDGNIMEAMFCDKDRCVLTCSSDGTARFWNTATHAASVKHEGGVLGAMFADKRTKLISWGRDRAVRFWGAPANINTASTFDGTTTGAVMSQDKTKVVTWSGDSVEPLVPSSDPMSPPSGLMSDDVVSDRMARIWDTSTGVALAELPHETPVLEAAFDLSGDEIFTCSRDTLTLWNLRPKKAVPTTLKIDTRLDGCTVSEDLSCAVAWNLEGALWLWRRDTGQAKSLGGERRNVYDAKFDQTRTRLLTCHVGWTRLWDAISGRLIEEYNHGENTAVHSARFSADGTKILTCSSDRIARIWNVGTPDVLNRLFSHERDPSGESRFYLGGALDSTTKRVLTWGDDGTARLWDVASGRMERLFRMEAVVEGTARGTVLGGRFTKDESLILTWSNDGTVALWDTQMNTPIRIFRHSAEVVGATFNPDEDGLLTFSKDGIAQLWDLHINNIVRDEDRVLEWEIRSGTEINLSGEYRVLSYDEWKVKKDKYASVE